ncbi:MAG TPA: class I SAM-dependent methyltransferase [Rhodothermales bacterium]
MSSQPTLFTDTLVEYVHARVIRETDVLRRLREETAKHPMSEMQISPDQGQFMGVLVRALGVQLAIEVGTFTGYSATVVAMNLPDNGELVACDVSEEYTAVALRYWKEAGIADRIDLRIGPAADTLRRLLDERGPAAFDFAFIDADKVGYDEYYELCMALIRRGGVMLFDNMFMDGRVADESNKEDGVRAIRALTQKLTDDPRVDFTIVPIADGVGMVRKR